MSRKILIGLFLLSSCIAHAQEKAFQFGFELAPNIGWISPKTENYNNNGIRAGFSWGFVGDIYLVENYAINTGLKFIYLNGKYEYPEKRDNVPGRTERKINSNYLQIPGVLRMRTQEISNGYSVYGDFGFALSLRLNASANERFYVNDRLFGTNNKKDVDNELRYSRTSMLLGAGVYKDLAESTKLMLGLRWDNNILNVLKGTNNLSGDKIKGSFHFVEMKIGVLF
ncbi:MAG TPA: porin family protein [Bacteroidales bacterium]|nr:porin family protein [Bacteroidales bacterium]